MRDKIEIVRGHDPSRFAKAVSVVATVLGTVKHKRQFGALVHYLVQDQYALICAGGIIPLPKAEAEAVALRLMN